METIEHDNTARVDVFADTLIPACPRCGLCHRGLRVTALLNGGEHTHFGTCPVSMQPILLRQIPEGSTNAAAPVALAWG